jgi:small-conductance mechanosensitive channel
MSTTNRLMPSSAPVTGEGAARVPGRTYRRVVVALAAVLLVSGPCALVAQIPGLSPPAQDTPKSAESAIAPIPFRDVPARADQDERFLQQLTVRSRQRAADGSLAARLAVITADVQALAQRFTRDELQQLPVLRLDALDRNWRYLDRELATWREDLQRKAQGASLDAEQLGRIRATWEATRDEPGAAPVVQQRVEALLRRIDATEEVAWGPLGALLDLGQAANATRSVLDAGNREFTAAVSNYDRRLLAIDAPPLWRAWRGGGEQARETERLRREALDTELNFLQAYFETSGHRVLVHALFAALLLPLLLWLSARTRRIRTDDPALQSALRVLRRPWSSWLVVSLVMVLLFESDAPLALLQALLLLALVPALRLLPRAVYDALSSWPYVLTGLFVLQRLLLLLVGHPAAYRSYLAVLALTTLAALIWLLVGRRYGRELALPPRSGALARTAAAIAAVLMLVAILANLLGNVSLAEVLTRGTLNSGYAALLLFAGSGVLGSAVKLLIWRRRRQGADGSSKSDTLLETADALFRVLALLAWVAIVLTEFRIYRVLSERTSELLAVRIGAGNVEFTLGSLLLFLFSVWLSFWVARTLRAILRDGVLGRFDLGRGVANSIASLTYYAVLLLGFLLALAVAGFELGQFAIVLGALGVGIGLGLQDVVRNFVSGLILMFERPIQPGDVVEVGGTSGRVRSIGMRATTVTTFEGADVVVPNGSLLSEKLINWTLSDTTRRLDVDVGVAYGTDPRRAMALLLEAARATPGVAVSPPPVVVFAGFGDSALNLSLRGWTHSFDTWVAIRTDLTLRVHDALAQAGIQIPFPQRDLHVRSVPSPATGAAVAGLAATAPPAAAPT